MEFIQGLHNLKEKHHGCVLTIGNFDGVHLGHKQVMNQVLQQSEHLGLPATVMVFEPQPKELFATARPPARLSGIREKYLQLKAQQLDRLICVKFTKSFASLCADDFIQMLHQQLGVKYLIIGDDFRFGHDRQGDFNTLKQAGLRLGFEVVDTKSFCLNRLRVSSTEIRQALARSDLQLAQQMLGRPYSICGRVSHGQKLGRTIGFPTANIPLKRLAPPVQGVYVVNVKGLNCRTIKGVANIGHRPTVNGVDRQLEVHMFDFNETIYGKQVEVELLEKLRDEQKFDSFGQLKEQISKDAQAAKNWFKNRLSETVNDPV